MIMNWIDGAAVDDWRAAGTEDGHIPESGELPIENSGAVERTHCHVVRRNHNEVYRWGCYAFFKLMCVTPLGQICASDHAMNAVDEMSAQNWDMKHYFEEVGASYDAWKQVEKTAEKYLTR